MGYKQTNKRPRQVIAGQPERGNDEAHQQAILDFLRNYISEHGYSPTVKEIAEHVHRTRPVVNRHLKTLEDIGLIESTALRRHIRVIDPQ